MAHHALLARLGLEIGMLCEKFSNLRLDRLGQQGTSAAAQDLRQGIGEGPGWASLITLLSDTAYHSFIGELEALNTTTIRRLTPSRRHQLLAIAQQIRANRFPHLRVAEPPYPCAVDEVDHADPCAYRDDLRHNLNRKWSIAQY
jgi:hypothetical protein